jgi:hypothetical protein
VGVGEERRGNGNTTEGMNLFNVHYMHEWNYTMDPLILLMYAISKIKL